MDEIIKERMLRTLKANSLVDWGEDEPDKVLKDMYLTNSYGCINESYMGDDLTNDIYKKFYSFLDAIRDEFDEFIEIYIDPSWEDRTMCLMILDSKVMFKYSLKAWNFWFNSEEELVEEMYNIYLEIKRKYPPKYKTWCCWTLNEEEILHAALEIYGKSDYTEIPLTEDELDEIAEEFKDRLAIMGEEWENVLKEIIEDRFSGY